jgi:hypothetical protein
MIYLIDFIIEHLLDLMVIGLNNLYSFSLIFFMCAYYNLNVDAVIVDNFVSCRIPPLGGVAVDLHLLYVEVTNRGGLEKVIHCFLVVI